MEIIFKELELKELEETLNLCNRCFDEQNNYEYAKKLFLEKSENDIYINGLYNGKVIAHTKVTIIKTMYQPMKSYAMINHLCVDKEFRRHHIASHLLDVIFKVAKERHCVEVVLWSKNFRTAAHSCYKNYGFKLLEAGFFSKEVEK